VPSAPVTLFGVCLLSGLSVAAEKVTFDDHVFPIFEQACLNCHNPDKAKGGLDLSTYPATLKGSSGGKIVEPGDTGSSLMGVVRQTSEPIMPPEGDALSSAQIKVLEAWITGGLLENTDSKAKKASKPKFDPTLAADPALRPAGPPPLPSNLLLEPAIVAPRSSAIHAMATSPWAPLLAVTGQQQILLYHSTHLDLIGILPFPEGEPVSLAFTPNGRYLIVGGGIAGKSGLTVTFDVTTGERVLKAAKEFDTVLSADLSPDLSKVVTGSPSKLIKLWNSEDGSQLASVKKHTDWIMSVDFSSDGILLATGDRNGGVWVWEGATGNEFHTLRGHQAGISQVQFRADSNMLATASEDGSVRFWEMNGGKEVKKIDAHKGGVADFAWGHDGSFATSGRDKVAKLWKPDFGQHKGIPNLPDIPTAIALDSRNKRLFIADYQGHIQVHETVHGKQVGSIDSNPPKIADRLTRIAAEQTKLTKATQEADSAHQSTLKNLQEAEKRMADRAKKIGETKHAHQQAKQGHEKEKQSIQATTQRVNHLTGTKKQAEEAMRKAQAEVSAQKRNVEDSQRQVEQVRKELAGSKKQRQEADKQTDPAKKAAAIEKADQQVQQHTQKLANATKHLEQQRKQLGSLETKQQQTNDHLKQVSLQWTEAKEKLANHQKALPPLKKTIDGTAKEITRLEKLGPEIQKQIDAAKEARGKSGSIFWKARLAGYRNEQEARRWFRAELLTRIIQTRTKIEENQASSEALAEAFAGTTKQLEQLQAELAEKRREHQAIDGKLKSATDEAERVELAAIENTLQNIIKDLGSDLAQLSREMGGQREQLDQLLPSIHKLQLELESNEALYSMSSGTSP